MLFLYKLKVKLAELIIIIIIIIRQEKIYIHAGQN